MIYLLVILILFVILDVAVVGYIIWKRTRHQLTKEQRGDIQKNWKAIIQQDDMRLAIMDADKLLDHALYLKGFRGNMGAKLKKSGGLFKNLNKLWAAHKVRNNIAHQINYQVNEKTYKSSMLAFKQAFKDLDIF